MKTKLYAGTVGWGVWGSDDLGETWDFAFKGIYAVSYTHLTLPTTPYV